MKQTLKITIVLLLSYAVSYAINCWLFDDDTFFSLPQIATWVLIAALLAYLFTRGDPKPGNKADE